MSESSVGRVAVRDRSGAEPTADLLRHATRLARTDQHRRRTVLAQLLVPARSRGSCAVRIRGMCASASERELLAA